MRLAAPGTAAAPPTPRSPRPPPAFGWSGQTQLLQMERRTKSTFGKNEDLTETSLHLKQRLSQLESFCLFGPAARVSGLPAKKMAGKRDTRWLHREERSLTFLLTSPSIGCEKMCKRPKLMQSSEVDAQELCARGRESQCLQSRVESSRFLFGNSKKGSNQKQVNPQPKLPLPLSPGFPGFIGALFE